MMSNSYYRGWEYYTPDPGAFTVMYCRVCDKKMVRKKNVNSATSQAESMSKLKHKHDVFYCRDSSKDWHKQVLSLKMKIENEPSQKITELLEEELKQILETKKTTKDLSWKYRMP